MPLDNPRNDELQIPWSLPDDHLHDDQDTEQHKFHRGKKLHKRSIRNYRHATTKWGAALESFKSMWVSTTPSSTQTYTNSHAPVRPRNFHRRPRHHSKRPLRLPRPLAQNLCLHPLHIRAPPLHRLHYPHAHPLDPLPPRSHPARPPRPLRARLLRHSPHSPNDHRRPHSLPSKHRVMGRSRIHHCGVCAVVCRCSVGV